MSDGTLAGCQIYNYCLCLQYKILHFAHKHRLEGLNRSVPPVSILNPAAIYNASPPHDVACSPSRQFDAAIA
jgi:hypothetical protein